MAEMLLSDLKFRTNPFYSESERLVVHHFCMSLANAGPVERIPSRNLDSLRSQLKEREQYLCDEERERLEWIEMDLRIQHGDKEYRGLGKMHPMRAAWEINQAWQQLARHIKSARQLAMTQASEPNLQHALSLCEADAKEILRILRTQHPGLQEWSIAKLRAECYEALGHEQLAQLFRRLAHVLGTGT